MLKPRQPLLLDVTYKKNDQRRKRGWVQTPFRAETGAVEAQLKQDFPKAEHCEICHSFTKEDIIATVRKPFWWHRGDSLTLFL